MSEIAWSVFAFAFVLAAWLLCNAMYGRVYGRRLRWRYLWAAHAALLFVHRFENWEQQ